MTIVRDDIKIKIKLLNSGNILAQATIILFDIWEEHGWKVLKSNKVHPTFQDEVWIQSPSFKSSGGWKELVFINDRKLFELVQTMIYDAYHMAFTKKEGEGGIVQKDSGVDTNNEEKEINYEKIPHF